MTYHMLYRFEVVLRHTEEKLLIPTRLPKTKPPLIHLPPSTPGCMYCMIYILFLLYSQALSVYIVLALDVRWYYVHSRGG